MDIGQRSQFFDSSAGDRIYSSADFSRTIQRLVRDGYVVGFNSELKVNLVSGLTVKVETGASFVQGRHFEVHTSAENFTLAAADPTNARFDRVVVRMDISNRQVILAVLTGTPGVTPVPSALTRTATIWELALATIRVGANQTVLVDPDIDDERNDETLCGQAVDPNTDWRIDANIAVSGWYRIGQNGKVVQGAVDGDSAHALFTVRDEESTKYSSVSFYASCNKGQNPTITMLNRSWFGSNGAITKIRLVHGAEFEGCAVEVFVNSSGATPVNFSMAADNHNDGFQPMPWVAGSVPTGFSSTVLNMDTIDPVIATAANTNADAFYVKRNGQVFSQGALIGGVTQTSGLGARVFRSSNQAISQTTYTAISFTTTRFNDNAIFDGVTPTRLTCKTAGTYVISGGIQWDLIASNERRVAIRLNGTTIIAQISSDSLGGSTGDETIMNVSTIWRMVVNDFVELLAWQNEQSSMNVVVASAFSPEFAMVSAG